MRCPLGQAGKLLEAGVVVKAVGFETNATNSRLLSRSHMRSNGLVDKDLWLLAEPHLDAGAFTSPFGSSYLNVVTYRVRSMLRYWRRPDLGAAVLQAGLPLVPIDSFTASGALTGAAELAAADPAAPEELQAHLREVAVAFTHLPPCHVLSARLPARAGRRLSPLISH